MKNLGILPLKDQLVFFSEDFIAIGHLIEYREILLQIM